MTDQITERGPESRSDILRKVRRMLDRTQADLAHALGTSTKTVQSYEQGWRRVPVRVMIQLFVLLAIDRKRDIDTAPCWEITGCPAEKHTHCSSYAIGGGRFCWFVSTRDGCPVPAAAGDELLPCISCPVIRRLLRTDDGADTADDVTSLASG